MDKSTAEDLSKVNNLPLCLTPPLCLTRKQVIKIQQNRSTGRSN